MCSHPSLSIVCEVASGLFRYPIEIQNTHFLKELCGNQDSHNSRGFLEGNTVFLFPVIFYKLDAKNWIMRGSGGIRVESIIRTISC